ncbi:MAG: type secretion protein [Caproiciproducens sp.]|jgi:flagellar biosynthesis protein|nr:type secretion protein [Caproiciproducens sp.]
MSPYEKRSHAAALKYSQDSSHNAPVVVAAGLGYVAQKIIDVAQDNNVPVFQDDALASLLSQLGTGSEIPPELYQAIVDIYVYFLNYPLDGLADKTQSEPK